MPIYRHVAIIMYHIDGPSVTARLDRCTRDITVGDTSYGFTHYTLCLEIDTRVEMVGTELAEVAAEQKTEIKRNRQHVLVRLRPQRNSQDKKRKKQQYPFHHYLLNLFNNLSARRDTEAGTTTNLLNIYEVTATESKVHAPSTTQ